MGARSSPPADPARSRPEGYHPGVDESAFDRVYETARALGEETRFRIYRRLSLSSHPASVSELAEDFSLHPNAVRQHLNRLEQAGLVVSRPHREGGAGRPRRLFHASPEALGFAPRPLGTLVSLLADGIKHLDAGRDELVEFGRSWGRAWAKRRKRENGMPRGLRARAEALAGELSEWGWEPTTREDGDRLRLETGRCLFRGSTPGSEGRQCAVEEGLLAGLTEGLLNGRVEVDLHGCQLELSV